VLFCDDFVGSFVTPLFAYSVILYENRIEAVPVELLQLRSLERCVLCVERMVE
jgi:hypothetical protein